MTIKAKYYWYALLAVFTGLSFFGLASLPKDWSAAKAMLTSTESWIAANAAHPILFALAVGLIFSTLIVPEAWRVARGHFFPLTPRSDMDVREVFRYLREGSKWSIGRPYEQEVNGENRLIDEEIDAMLRSAAAQERLHIWGKEDTRSWIGNETEILLRSDIWLEHRFDLVACVTPGSSDAKTWSMNRAHGAVFKELRANKAEIQKEWPPASYLRRKLDRTLKDRTYN